jgi:glycosyltransferase involved in cell wall biosynthesis
MNRSLRICLISREYPPETHIGGIASYTYKTAGALARLDHEVHVVTAAWKPGAEYVERGVHVHRFEEPRVKPRELQAVAHAARVARTVAGIRGTLDVVQACEWGGEAALYALTPDRRPLLVTRLATPLFLVERINEHSRMGARGYGQRALERLQALRSDAVISPTRALARIVSDGWHLPLERITVVPTGMEMLPPETGLDGAAPAEVGDTPYVLYFGRLEERKGVHVLGQALPRVLAAHPALRAVFVGDDLGYRGGSMREAIRAAAGPYADRLVFLPRLPQRDLFPILRRALIVALPSLWENLANTCLEAMQLGKPVIATTGCGFEEVLDDGLNGYLVPPGDADALAARLLAALAEPDELARVGEAARLRVSDFAIEPMAARLADFYAEALARRGTPQTVAETPVWERERSTVEIGPAGEQSR